MLKKKKDLHIALLKFGRDKLEFGVTFEEFCTHMKDCGYDISIERLALYFWDNYRAFKLEDRPNNSSPESFTTGAKFSLTVEATFRLIEYEEFESANRNSTIATIFAIAALSVSIYSAVYSIRLSQKQLETPTKIDHQQLSKILRLEFDSNNIDQRLEEMIEMQKLQQQVQEKKAEQEEPNESLNSTPKSGAN